MDIYTLLVEDLEQDCIGTNSVCLGVFSSKENLFNFFITYLLRNHAYDICTQEEIDAASDLCKDPVTTQDSKFPACDERGKCLLPVQWTKEELLNYFNVEPGFGKREYTIGSSIFSWSDHGLDNTYESMYQ